MSGTLDLTMSSKSLLSGEQVRSLLSLGSGRGADASSDRLSALDEGTQSILDSTSTPPIPSKRASTGGGSMSGGSGALVYPDSQAHLLKPTTDNPQPTAVPRGVTLSKLTTAARIAGKRK